MYVTLRGVPDPKTSSAHEDTQVRTGARGRVPGTVIGLGVVSLLTDISSESVAAVLPLYITAVLGMGPLAYGFIDGIYQGVSAAVRMLGGWWADSSRRPKWVAVVGYAASALSRVGLLLAGGFWTITSVIALDRLGKGLRTGPRDALIAAASDPKHLGRNFGVHRALDTTGALIGPLLAFAVLALFPLGLGGYDSVFVLSTAFAIMGLAVLVVVVPDLRTLLARKRAEAPATVRPAAKEDRPRLAHLTQPGLRRLLIVAGLLSIVTVGDGFIYLALSDGAGIAPQYFPLLFVGTNVAYLALAIPLGRFADRFGRAKVFLIGHVLLIGIYAVAASRLGGLAGIVIVLLMLGTFYAATDGVLAALASHEVPEASRASGIAAAQTVVALARFGCSIGFGVLWQWAGKTTALWAMGIALVLALAASAWMLRGMINDNHQNRRAMA